MIKKYFERFTKRTLVNDVTLGLVAVLLSVILIVTVIIYFVSAISAEISLEKTSREKIVFISSNLSDLVWNFNLKDISSNILGYVQSEDISGIRVTINTGEKIEQFSEKYDTDDRILKNDILYAEKKIGTVEMFISPRRIRSLKITLFVLSLFMMISIIFTLFLAVKYLLQRFLDIPMSSLMESMDTIAKGGYGHHIPHVSQEDINRVIDKVNLMSDQISLREHEINKVKNYLKNIIASMPSAFIAINQSFTINLWNIEASRLTGLSESDVYGNNLWSVFPFFKKYKDMILDVSKSHIPRHIPRQEIQGREERLYDIFLYPIYGEHVNDIVIRIDDITDIERERDQLRQMQKMETIGTLAGGLAHDFNNILSGIIGPVSLLQFEMANEKFNYDSHVEYLTMIDDSAKRAASIVKQLLSLSRKQEIEIIPVDINMSVHHVVKLCSNSFDKNISINVKPSEELASIMADPYQIEQVLLNLCVNASHAVTIMRKNNEKKGGTIDIAIEKIYSSDDFIYQHPEAREGYYHVVTIKDDGVGITKRNLTKIFDPFFSTKEQGKGTGLGLAMVYSIVKQHNGFIDVYSEEGLGTSFNLYFPAAESESDKSGYIKEKEIFKGSGLILVCDDDSNMRLVAERILSKCGYDVVFASDGMGGVEIYQKRHSEISAVLLDTIMPGLSGPEAYAQMKKINPDVKVLIASGFTRDSRIEEILKKGVKHFIQKPYNLFKLSEVMYKVIYEDQAQN